MRIGITVSTPKHVYIWSPIAAELEDRGHITKIALRDYGETLPVAEGRRLEGEVFGECRGGPVRRMLEYPSHLAGHFREFRSFGPDILAGYGFYGAHTSKLLRCPAIGFNDTEKAPGQNQLIKLLSDCVCVTAGFQGQAFGHKQLEMDTYLELAYLHPRRFDPDIRVKEELGLDEGDRYAVLRFNALDASHDVGVDGFSLSDRIALVEELSEYGDVFIVPEEDPPEALTDYVIPTEPHRIHHVLYFADLYAGDSGTMQNEAAVLGTPSIRLSHLPKEEDRGNSRDLSESFGLLKNVRDQEQFTREVVETFRGGRPVEAKQRRAEMLSARMDPVPFISWFLEEYPKSREQLEELPEETQDRFRPGESEIMKLLADERAE